MNYFLQHIFLLFLLTYFSVGCSISEFSQQTKDGFNASRSYISEKGKMVYQKGKNKLGLSIEKQAEVSQ